jgi:HPt (histidine-containing phosphotransfer) domain-containing protein
MDECARETIDQAAGPGTPSVPAPRTDSAPTVLDPTTIRSLEELAAMIGIPELASMIDAFLEDCPRLIAEMGAAAARDDARGLAAAAHNLRGTSANHGAGRLANTAAAIEAIAESGDLSGSSELLSSLDAQLVESSTALRAKFPPA